MSTSSSSSGSGSHFVLVHGAAHGAWCWYRIRCLLECTGHKVTCPDLCGSGIDTTDPATISTFAEYNQPLDDTLSALPEDEKVILVGHSAGGLSLTAAIHNYPHKLLVAVFVGAAMYKNGFDTPPSVKINMMDYSEYEDKSYEHNLRNYGSLSSLIHGEGQVETIYQLSPLEDRTLAAMLIRPYPSDAIRRARFPDGKETDTVPRVYMKTLHDRCYSQEKQDEMIQKWPPSNVYEIDSDHFPMFSNPYDFFGLLLKVANEFGCN
ncbi:methylesterase 17-like isoform X1 [Silene latifolia]|uniref:methylesterase 17-like isoform X1 n=1 Tax=Silene latifolia TaxID=37657 RepID=UPI003D780177